MATDNGSTTKSDKYARAVARATGNELTVRNGDAQPESTELAIPELPVGLAGVVGIWRADELLVDMAKGDMEWAPRVINLQEGMYITGILEGRGGDVEMDEVDSISKTVKTKIVSTWVVREPKSGLRVSFLTAAQLEDKLPPFIGGLVKIYCGKMLESKKGRRFRDYQVGGAKLDGGRTRTFARALPPASVIDVAEANHGIVPGELA